ncbi:MAG TPA: transglycosylase SLT domain-containing protein [Gammaproteobacteria bacterium]|nr:transglycosylase SLT domain-containing protein [Gammaproteobacteria bacterium]
MSCNRFRQLMNLGLLAALVILSFSLHSASITEQRAIYEDAKKALRTGNLKQFHELAESIRDYPLYVYLRYNYLSPRIHRVKTEEMQTFLQQYPDFPPAEALRTRWLKYLAKTRQWQTLVDNYTPQEDEVLQCQYLQARIQTNNDTLLLEDIRSIWLSGKSLPAECDPAFKRLYASDLLTNNLVWQRIELAMQTGNTGLANYLGRYLDGYYREWAQNWIKVHNDPSHYTRNPPFADTQLARQILIHGIIRLAHLNINRAIENWQQLQDHYTFTPGERGDVDKVIAVRAARKNHPLTLQLMDRISPFNVDDDVFHWRLISALENNDWERLRRWTDGVPANEDLKLRWFYWHARALEHTGDSEKARHIYASIAGKRDYYGFLAADRLEIAYNMQHQPLPQSREEKDKIRNLHGIRRAEELREIKQNFTARREWHYAMRHMTSYQKEIAATLAADWGWHDLAIVSLGSAHSYDDLEVRFPIPYQTLIAENAEKRQLDPGWVYALVRSESAFIEDVRSPAGAIGLMQVMPQTGKEVARSMGIKNFRTTHLEKAEKNIPIGSTYLRQMLDRFMNNMTLATAAYNAGPARVKSWLPKSGCEEADIWVERIPFNETRKYVRRVMFFASIYDWRLHRKVLPLKERMAVITPADNKLMAGLACTAQEVSYN